MIVKVVHFFSEGRWSFYPGETFHAESLEAERDMPMERVNYHRDIGRFEVTEDGDPEPGALADGAFEDLMEGAGREGEVSSEGFVPEGLAETGPHPTMTN